MPPLKFTYGAPCVHAPSQANSHTLVTINDNAERAMAMAGRSSGRVRRPAAGKALVLLST